MPPLKMTRAEYEAKYGAKAPTGATSTAPIKMTRAEYEAKYGVQTQKPKETYQGGNVAQDFAKAVVDPLSKIGASAIKMALPKSLEGPLATGKTKSVFGGKDVNLVGYRDGQKLQGKEFTKDVLGTALEGASYFPITRGVTAVGKGIAGTASKVGGLAKEFGTAGFLQGAGSEYQQGGTTGEAVSSGITTGAISTVAGPVVGKGIEIAGKGVSDIAQKIKDPVKYYTESAKTNAMKAVNVIGGVKPAEMSKIKDKAYRAFTVIKNINPTIKRGEIDVPLDLKNSETPYLDVNDAIVQTRKKVYEGIDGAYKEATGKALTINPKTLLNELRSIYNNTANATEKRSKAISLRDELLGMTDKDGNIPIENIAIFTPQLNQRAKPGFGASSALGAQMDKDFAIKLSDFVDDAVEKIGIPQLRDLKDDYSSLKAVEKYILNEAKKEARRLDNSIAANIGDVGSAEILSGIVDAFRATTGDAQAATSLARGVAMKVFSKARQAAGDRANYLRNVFDDLDKIQLNQRSSPKNIQMTKQSANIPPISGDTAQSIKNSNSGTIQDTIPLATDNASIIEKTKKFLRKNPRGMINLDAEIFPKKATLPTYKETGNLTTKILKDLEGKSTVSKQYILDATNRGELKQQERDIIRQALETEGNTVDVAKFAEKVKAELLPLKREPLNNKSPYGDRYQLPKTKYENIALPDELRGNVKNYEEQIYSSPIKTSAGATHFGENTPNYFGHTRIEDMADNKTRRVIEVQSDLYQKGNLEREIRNAEAYDDLLKRGIVNKKLDQANRKQIRKLEQYSNPTAHFRMIREEIKKAAEDGKTKLQFPTGETAMKIEGLGETTNWRRQSTYATNNYHKLESSDLKTGLQINDGNSDWIITDVLGDGKFKAVSKRNLEALADDMDSTWQEELQNVIDDPELGVTETFDISGKVDTNNPIYKFYEKDLGRYLSNKYGAKTITDENGVKWYEVAIDKKKHSVPVEAFAIGGIAALGAANQKASAMENSEFDWEATVRKGEKKLGFLPGTLKFERKNITHPENIKRFEEMYKYYPQNIKDAIEAMANHESYGGKKRINKGDQVDDSDSLGILHMGQGAVDEFNKRKAYYGYGGPDIRIEDIAGPEGDIIQKFIQASRIMRDMRVNGRSLKDAITYIQNSREKGYGEKVLKKFKESKL